MDIKEAVKQSLETGKKIILQETTGAEYNARVLVKPTNTSDCCILYLEEDGKEVSHRRAWMPTADDLLSDAYELANE